jgi:hypothetical protein
MTTAHRSAITDIKKPALFRQELLLLVIAMAGITAIRFVTDTIPLETLKAVCKKVVNMEFGF